MQTGVYPVLHGHHLSSGVESFQFVRALLVACLNPGTGLLCEQDDLFRRAEAHLGVPHVQFIELLGGVGACLEVLLVIVS